MWSVVLVAKAVSFFQVDPDTHLLHTTYEIQTVMSIIDDTNLLFDYQGGLWSLLPSTSGYNSTLHVSTDAGASLAFGPFTASSVAVFGTINSNQAPANYLVDNTNIGQIQNENSSNESSQLLYEASGLDTTTQHNLRIIVTNTGTYSIDYVSLDDEIPVSSPPNSSPSSSITSFSTVSPAVSFSETVSGSQSTTSSSSQSSLSTSHQTTAGAVTSSINTITPVLSLISTKVISRSFTSAIPATTTTVATSSVTSIGPQSSTFAVLMVTSSSFTHSVPLTTKVISSPSISPTVTSTVKSQAVLSEHGKITIGTVIGVLALLGAVAGLLFYFRGSLFKSHGYKKHWFDRFKLKSSRSLINPFILESETPTARTTSQNDQVLDIRNRITLASNVAVRSSSANSAGGFIVDEKRRSPSSIYTPMANAF